MKSERVKKNKRGGSKREGAKEEEERGINTEKGGERRRVRRRRKGEGANGRDQRGERLRGTMVGTPRYEFVVPSLNLVPES